MLTAALTETFIPTAIISDVTVHSAVGFDEMISRGDSYSTLCSPNHTLEAAVIWAAMRRFTASKDFTFHGGHLLPSLQRCTTLCHEHHQQRCSKLLPWTLPAPPGAFLASAPLLGALPAPRLHRQTHQRSKWSRKWPQRAQRNLQHAAIVRRGLRACRLTL